MSMSNYPNGFRYGLTVRNQPILSTHSGNIFWVGKTPEGQAGSNGYDGTYNWPFATIDFAVGKCAANHGDIIVVKAGHTETVSAAGTITVDIAGVSIIGLGTGADRPSITFGTVVGASMLISAASITVENIVGISGLDALTNPFNVTGSDCHLDIEWQDSLVTVEAVRAVLATTVSRLFAKVKYVGFIAGDACVNAVRLVAVTGARIIIDAYGEFSTGIVEMVTTASTDVLANGYFYNDNVALTKNIVNTGGLACTWYAKGYDGKGGYFFSGGSASALAYDDVPSVGVQVSVVDSRLIVADAAVDSVGVQVSTTDSRLIAVDGLVDSVGVQTSTVDSRLIVADAAVDSVGVQTSTADSRLLATTTSVGTQVSATDSRLIVADAAVDSVGVQVSTTDSRLLATTTASVDSVGVQVSTTDSRLIVNFAQLVVAEGEIDSVGVQVSTTDSRLIAVDALVDSVGVQTSATDSRLIVADAAVDSVGVQTSTADSRLLATTTSIGTQVSTTDSRLIVADAAVDSVGVQVSTTDSRLIVADAAVDSVGVQVSTVDSRLILVAHGAVKVASALATANLFTIAGGMVKVLNIVGYITTACQASANATKLVMTPTGGTATDICATLDLNAAGQYGLLAITGTFANAMALTATAGIKADVQATPFLTSPGVISMNCAASTTGVIAWYIEYIPLDTDATIVAA